MHLIDQSKNTLYSRDNRSRQYSTPADHIRKRNKAGSSVPESNNQHFDAFFVDFCHLEIAEKVSTVPNSRESYDETRRRLLSKVCSHIFSGRPPDYLAGLSYASSSIAY